MAYINTGAFENFVELYIQSAPDATPTQIDNPFGTGNLVETELGVAGGEVAAGALLVPALQEVTVNATPGLFRWKQLDSLSEYVITTSSTNSLGMNLVVDPSSFFGNASATADTVQRDGIFKTTNEKYLVCFRLYWAGSEAGDDYVEGIGYMSGLAPTTNPDAPVWVSPITIEVAGNYNQGQHP